MDWMTKKELREALAKSEARRIELLGFQRQLEVSRDEWMALCDGAEERCNERVESLCRDFDRYRGYSPLEFAESERQGAAVDEYE